MSKPQAKIKVWSPHLKPTELNITARSAKQQAYIEAMENHSLVLASGPAGTGKTYLAAALAARALTSGVVKKIIMSRPALEAGERIGFLPGDMREKIDPYLRPLYDALGQVIGDRETQRYIQSGLIEIAPLAFMRGRSLANAFVILDEAQNCTKAQMKMFLTRMAQGSIFVICGDSTQSDLPLASSSGFRHALEVLANLESVAMIGFGTEDIQRDPLVAEIVRAYEKGEEDA
jgi:phosphate starvation-inducible PhoH-like protein